MFRHKRTKLCWLGGDIQTPHIQTSCIVVPLSKVLVWSTTTWHNWKENPTLTLSFSVCLSLSNTIPSFVYSPICGIKSHFTYYSRLWQVWLMQFVCFTMGRSCDGNCKVHYWHEYYEAHFSTVVGLKHFVIYILSFWHLEQSTEFYLITNHT